jgi:hypothetical protein
MRFSGLNEKFISVQFIESQRDEVYIVFIAEPLINNLDSVSTHKYSKVPLLYEFSVAIKLLNIDNWLSSSTGKWLTSLLLQRQFDWEDCKRHATCCKCQ